MTTPLPPAPPTTPISGAGTLGTNVLQTSVDTLDRSVNTLNATLASLAQTIQSNSNQMGGSGSGNITRQQGPSATSSGFPSMFNFFRQGNVTSGGNAGGGTAGVGSLSSAAGGMGSGILMAGASLASFGANQSSNLVGLNSYQTQSMTGFNYNGMSASQAQKYLYAQAGATQNSQISIGTGTLSDNLGAMSTLQQRAGSMGVNQTAIGRAASSGMYSFGITNPNMTATSAASAASAMYSPTFSYNMMTMGYRPILSQTPGGKPLNAGQSAMSILGSMGLAGKSSSQVYGNLSSGVGQSNLSYLLQGSGVSNTAMTSYLRDYAQLIDNKKMTPTAATALMQAAGTGSSASMQAARNKLSGLGISSANNDLAALTQNQASQTGRSGTYIDSFNTGLQAGAGLLKNFNNAITSFLSSTGLGSAIGYGGGLTGTLAGASHIGNTALGLYGLKSVLGGAASSGAGGAAGSAAGSAAGGVTASAGLTAAATGAATVAGIAAASVVVNKLTPAGTRNGTMVPRTNVAAVGADNIQRWLHNAENFVDPMHWFGGSSTQASTGGGAAGVSMGTSQQVTSGANMTSVSGQAKKAVSAAESQKGVPYQYGAELPGVGFDCSALIQWAYKQASSYRTTAMVSIITEVYTNRQSTRG